MSVEKTSLHLPKYDDFLELLEPLSLPISGSELHGMMCGYLCANKDSQGEAYLRALLGNKKDDTHRGAALAMFSVFSVSQQQIGRFDFEFEFMLPDDDVSLLERATAFSEWCDGFVQALTVVGIGFNAFHDDESQEALEHLTEFADLDCNTLDVTEEDEKALMEVTEYARMAVLRLHSELVGDDKSKRSTGVTH